jgi:sn-glycerol 3-phosphate transport system substrate-binding protein
MTSETSGPFDGTANTASPPDGPVAIDVWLNDFPWPGLKDAVKQCTEEFGKAHPGYEINLRFVNYWTMPARVAKAVEEGHPPAIAEYYYTSTQLARDAKAKDGTPLYTSVEEAIGGREEILGVPVVLDDIVAAARDYYSYDGTLFSLPRNTSTLLLFANTSLLDAAGISELPTTWDELETACAAVAGLPDPPAHCSTWPVHGWVFQQALAQQSGLLADHDNGRSGRAEKVDLASEEMIAYVTWWQRLHEKGYYTYTGREGDWLGAYKAFASGQVALTLASSHEVNTIVRAGRDAGFEVGVGWVPYNDRVPNAGAIIGGDSTFLAAGLDKATEDGALAFLQYLVNPANAAGLHKAGDWMPITESSVDVLDDDGWFAEKPYLRVATNQLRAAANTPASLGALLGDFPGIQHVMDRAMIDVLVSGADPVARFTQATTEAQTLLDDYTANYLDSATVDPRYLKVF